MKGYLQTTREELARMGHIGTDPRHVLGYMYLEHSTLDALDMAMFRKEIKIAVDCINAGGTDTAERLAKSYGL